MSALFIFLLETNRRIGMNKLKPEEGLRLFDINWETDTAGPSPNKNKRIEVFLLGCDRAMEGNPCKGCFNNVTWNKDIAEHSWDPIELADMVNEGCDPNNKYVTIGGGEPTDQIDKLIPFVKRLKEHNFHIMMYTWRSVEKLFHEVKIEFNEKNEIISKSNPMLNDFKELLKYLDIVVDGEFKQEECLYQQDLGDGMLSSIGSGNQMILDIKEARETSCNENLNVIIGYKMKDLVGLYIKPDSNDLVYITK